MGSFQTMTPEKRREISSKGGKAAHAAGKAHKWTSEEAKIAGRKGGIAAGRRKSSPPQVGNDTGG